MVLAIAACLAEAVKLAVLVREEEVVGFHQQRSGDMGTDNTVPDIGWF